MPSPGGRRAAASRFAARAGGAARYGESFGTTAEASSFSLLSLRFAVARRRARSSPSRSSAAPGPTIPDRDRPVRERGNWPLGITGIVGADLARSGLFRLVDYAGVSPRPVRAEDVRVGDWRARGADAVVVGSMRPLRRRPRRGALRAGRRGQADAVLASQVYTVTPAQFRATAHRIADVIYEKLTGDAGRVLARASPTSPSRARASSCRSPTPTAPIRRRSSPRTSRCCRRAGRPTARASPTCRSSRRSRSSTCSRSPPGGGRWSPTSAAATARRRGRRTAARSPSR